MFRVPILISMLICLACAVLVASQFDTTMANLIAIAVMGSLFLFVLTPWLQAVISMRNPIMASPFRHAFSDSGIASAFEGGSISLDWSQVRRATETARFVGIWGKRGIPMVLPKNQLSVRELTALREILRAHLNDNAKLGPE